MRKLIGYGFVALGLIIVIYGFSEHIYDLKNVQLILSKLMETKPQLYNDPVYRAIINLSVGHSTSIVVSTYIEPGFILSALGFIIIFMEEILQHFDGIRLVINEVISGVNDALKTDDEDGIIKLTKDMEIKKDK